MADEEKPAGVTSVNNSKWEGLTGWPLLEQFVNELDTAMVDGHNDDINTFLTFAGLFSAVLTGLLVLSFVLLQPDDTNNGDQKLDHIYMALHQISMQLFNPSTPPIVPVSEDTTSFKPLRSSLWINSLWFLSLVLSLGAALLGMIAKQWLREFLSWTTMSGLSEIQVLLRHIRYQAFLRWKVPAVIASVPVLLETSLIMFLVGLCILLGTLDDLIVFGLCTTAVGILVINTIAVAILPVRYPQCPYKSPVGWGALIAWHTVAFLRRRIVHTSQTLWRRTTLTTSDTPVTRQKAFAWKDWRQRELKYRKWVATAFASNQEPRIYAPGRFTASALDDRMTHNMVAHIKDLFFALEWITETSQNMRILQAVEECAPAFPQGWSPFSCLVVDVHIACEILNIDLRRLVPPKESCVEAGGRGSQTVVKLIHSGEPSFQLQVLRAHSGPEGRPPTWEGGEQKLDVSPSMAILIAHSIARDLSASIGDTISTEDDMDEYGCQANYYLQAATALACYLIQSTASSERRTSTQLTSVIEQLAAIFARLTRPGSTSRFSQLCPPLHQIIRDCEFRLRRQFLRTVQDAGNKAGVLESHNQPLPSPSPSPSPSPFSDASHHGPHPPNVANSATAESSTVLNDSSSALAHISTHGSSTTITDSRAATHSASGPSVSRVAAVDFDPWRPSRPSQIDQVHEEYPIIVGGRSLASHSESPPVRSSDLLFSRDSTVIVAHHLDAIEMKTIASDK